MRLSTVITALLSLLFAISLAIVTKAVNPAETVNGIWLVVSSACFFIIIYRLYGRFLAAKVLRLDAALVALMAVLAVVAVADSAFKWQGLLSRNKDLEHRGLPAETTED